MEIKIGVQHVNREIVVDAADSARDVEKAITTALDKGTVLTLTDERGRKVMIPAGVIGYIDISEENARHVGFGSV